MPALRLGLIGAGRWSRAYLKTVAARSDAQIVRVARRKPLPLDAPFAHIEVTADWRQVAAAEDLDGVILATPPSFHAEPAITALRAGLPVLIEKPMTLSVAEARAVVAAAHETRVPVMVEHTHLYHPAYAAIRAQAAGHVLDITSRAGNWGTFHHDYSSLWDWGAHDVAMTLALARAAPAELTARRIATERVPEGVGELFELDLRFARGDRARLTFGNILQVKTRRFLVDTGSDRLLYDDWCPPRLFRAPPAYTVEQAPAGLCEAQACPEAMPLSIALELFCERIRTRVFSPSNVERGLQVVEVLAEAERQVGPPP